MNDVFYDFRWTVAPDYEWQDWLDENGQPVVVPSEGYVSLESATAVELAWSHSQESGIEYGPVLSPIFQDVSELRRYQPMTRDHAALFREFGELDYEDTKAIAGFASRYGNLGVPVQSQSIGLRRAEGEWPRHHAHGEPHLRWALEICLMREALCFADRKGTLEGNRRFKWLFDRHLQSVQGRLGFSKAGEPRLTLAPLTLVSAMWLQLAIAITGEKRFVACKFCRRMLEISTEQTGFRSHREFCSDSCKTKDYRKRKRTALRLAAEGARLSEISDKTGTELATIRSWIGAAKRGRNAATTARE